MLELTDPVAAVPKIGPKYRTLLERLEIFTVEDLLYHFPFMYDDFSEVKDITDLQEGELATVQGVLGEVKNIFTRYGKRLTQAKVMDSSGTLDLVWFNSHYLKKTLKPGQHYNFSGKIGKFGSKINMVAPTYELVGDSTLNTGRLVPVYPETAGISSKWLRGKIDEVFQKRPVIEEFLPKEILETEKLPKFDFALKTFHFPNSHQQANLAKKRFQLEELFLELVNVETRRATWGEKLSATVINSLIHADKISNLRNSIPFDLSDSQNLAIEEILDDIKKEHPMNRLLEGDVGTGKTMVAIFTAYVTYLNNLNTLYMAPTEILAKQHYETFKQTLKPFGIQVGLATSAEKTDLESEPYILIGTHALLYKEEFENVGLVVIDEQQRFGVEQRAQIQAMNNGDKTPHLLTMTATPIPRTLALTIYGDLEISQLQPIPSMEKKITTRVVPENQRDTSFEWIKQKGQQTFIVCPFIEESSHADFENVKAATAEYEKLKKGVFKGIPIGLLHGRMTAEEKRAVVEDFEKGIIQILVSTPVIEVGIDIPEASIMVIESAERYGLASLHQLRGRIGRKGQEGHCLIFMSGNNRTAYKRLKYLEEYNNGLELAEIDLELRGAGDIYGTMQHGFKKFKIARLSDLEMLEKAKKYAKKYFPQLDKHPLLKKKIYSRSGRFVGNN